MVSMSTRTSSPSAATIRRVASIPSRCGMRMSMTATSGLARARGVDRLQPVLGLGDDRHVGLGLDDLAQPAAHERLVVGEQDPDHGVPPASGSRARTA